MSEIDKARAAFPDLLAGIAAGELIKDLLAKHGLQRKTVSRLIVADRELHRQWDEARESSADAFMDEAMDVARSDIDKEYAQHARTRIDTLKWAARIRNPRLYGDRSSVDLNVRTIDLTRIIQDANARLAAQQQGRIIEGTSNNCGALPALAHAQTAPELQPALDHALLASIL